MLLSGANELQAKQSRNFHEALRLRPLSAERSINQQEGMNKMKYPGYFLKIGTENIRIVAAIQRRLIVLGCGPLTVDRKFGKTTRDAVKIFQVRATDRDGLPLKVDGIVGPVTWGALFGEDAWITEKTTPLLSAVLEIAGQEVGVLEEPPGENRGPRVDEYVRSVGLDPAEKHPWCAAFIYWCFEQASKKSGVENPAVRTAGVLDHWSKAGKFGIGRLVPSEIDEDLTLLKPGLVFVIKTGSWQGHMGLVRGYQGGKLVTIEGNTSVDGNPEGIGVFLRHGRKLADINKGYLDYSRHE